MSQEWPISKPEPAAPEEMLLPLALHEHVELILASPEVRLFAERRAEQLLEHGHSAADDATHTIDYLVRQAQSRLSAFVERSGCGRHMNAPAAQREILERYLEKAGALLLAARARLGMQIPEQPGAAE